MRKLCIFGVVANAVLFLVISRGNARFRRGDGKMFYSAAVALRQGQARDLYSPGLHAAIQRTVIPDLPEEDVKVYTHPPFELLAFLPLSFLGYRAAMWAWVLTSIGVGLLCGRLVGNYWAVLGVFPMLALLIQQQDSILALLLVILCWRFVSRGRFMEAGFALGLALFRFQFVIPLAFLLIRRWPRILKGFIVSALLVAAVSVALVRPSGVMAYGRLVANMAQESSTAVSGQYHVDPRTMPSLRGLIYELASLGKPQAAATLAPVLPFASMLCVLGPLIWAAIILRGMPSDLAFCLAVIVSLLSSYHLLMHDLILLVVPLALLPSRSAYPLGAFLLGPALFLFYPHAQALLVVPMLIAVYQISSEWRRSQHGIGLQPKFGNG